MFAIHEKPSFDVEEQIVAVELGSLKLEGELVIPTHSKAIIIVAHTMSLKYSDRLRYFAHLLREAGLATILINLLTEEEDIVDQRSKFFRSNIRYLASRLVGITDWLTENPITSNLQIGYFGTSAGGGAVLLAATERPAKVGAVVSAAGQTYLGCSALPYLQTPTLLIVGGNDYPTIAMNEDALSQIYSQNKQLEVIPGATHKFQEPGALEEVARLASQWFKRHLKSNTTNDKKLSGISVNSISK
jgi:putative phosphoribosyl transferase